MHITMILRNVISYSKGEYLLLVVAVEVTSVADDNVTIKVDSAGIFTFIK